MPQAVHREVMKVARAAAGEHYEVLMKDNLLFTTWQKKNPGKTPKQLESIFIEKTWPMYIRFARTTMTLLLSRPDVDEKTKEQIHEALVLDKSLTIGRYDQDEVMAALKLQSEMAGINNQVVRKVRQGSL